MQPIPVVHVAGVPPLLLVISGGPGAVILLGCGLVLLLRALTSLMKQASWRSSPPSTALSH